MTRKKQVHTITRPFTHVHSTLTALGFTEMTLKDGSAYELTFRDPLCSQRYTYSIPTQTDVDSGLTVVNLKDAAFKDKGEIPSAAHEYADRMISEVQQYLYNQEKKRSAGTPIEMAQNGRMANNPKELKRLGNEMAKMPTNSKLMANGLIPDPIQ